MQRSVESMDKMSIMDTFVTEAQPKNEYKTELIETDNLEHSLNYLDEAKPVDTNDKVNDSVVAFSGQNNPVDIMLGQTPHNTDTIQICLSVYIAHKQADRFILCQYFHINFNSKTAI